MDGDDFNLHLVTSTESVDQINRSFYERFPFPPAPLMISELADPTLEIRMLNQGVGSWDHRRLPRNLRIWIAGCGRNQAFITALRFPDAQIVASDLSAQSLADGKATAAALGLRNIDFRHQSITSVDFHEEFDYVLCTGVIHHNADPAQPLQKLAAAVKKSGVVELMVYNRYHRILTTAFQKAVRLLGRGRGFDFELQTARAIAGRVQTSALMASFIQDQMKRPEAELADSLVQPVEYSYTVESLQALLAGAGLELMTACPNQFDKANKSTSWDLQIEDPTMQSDYEELPDVERWKIANHLLLERSPMLWFYCQRQDSPLPWRSEKDLCSGFLESRFTPAATQRKIHYRTAGGSYEPSHQLLDFPGVHPQADCRKIVEALAHGGRMKLRDVLSRLGVRDDFTTVNRLRVNLTTSEFPYLLATPPA